MGINIGYLEQQVHKLNRLLAEAEVEGVTDTSGNPISVRIKPASVIKTQVEVYSHRCVCCEELGNDFTRIGNGYMCSECLTRTPVSVE